MPSSPVALFFKATTKFFPSQLRFWDEKKDKISELPQDVIDCIFDRMPIRDVARTSILSKKWRHISASYPKLVFDDNFFKEVYKHHKQSIRYEYPKAIDSALLVRGGPIFKFVLHIPNILNDLSPEIDRWMLFLSRNGIRELELNCLNPTPYIVPSCIFLCRSLSYLELRNCILKPPHEFEGFHLVSLNLTRVSISFDFSATLLESAPMLEKLIISCCSGIEHRSIYAPRLNHFCIIRSGKVDWEWFARHKKLRYVQIVLDMEVKNIEKKVIMKKFLKDMPKLQTLVLDGFSLKFLATSDPYKVPVLGLIPSAPLVTRIYIHDFRVDDLDQISSTYCLLRNCPNLMFIQLLIADDVSVSKSNENSLEQITEYLKLSNCKDVRLDKLETVQLQYMKGIKPELVLIKLLLDRSPRLQTMNIVEESGGIIGYLISREILRLPRASMRAEIKYITAKHI